MKTRRGNGEGSLFQDSKGRWVASIHIGYRDGKRLRRWFYCRTKAEAIEKLTTARHHKKQGSLHTGRMPNVAAWLETWLNGVNVRASTRRSYVWASEYMIIPAVGHIRLDELAVQDVQGMITRVLKTHAPQSAAKARAVLRIALNAAMREEMIFRNVAHIAKPPRITQYEAQSLTVDQANLLLQEVEGDDFEAIYSVALPLGLRRGEILGLRWQDIDFTTRELTVRKTLQTFPGLKPYLQLVEPKTKRSRRTLVMPELTLRALQEHRSRQLETRLRAGPTWQDNDLVFTSPLGGPVGPEVLLRRFWKIRAKLGWPTLRFHDLRHSAISIMAAQRVPLRLAMEIAGHTQLSTTAEIYSHVTSEEMRSAAAAMDRAFPVTATTAAG